MWTRRVFSLGMAAAPLAAQGGAGREAVEIGSRRELFVDEDLVAERRGVELMLGDPRPMGTALTFDEPWEGRFSGYSTAVALPGGGYRLYYRGVPNSGQDGRSEEVTCVAESADGVSWRKASLEQYPLAGRARTNVILAGQPPFSHNFVPFVDTRPGCPAAERFKAVAGIHRSGLLGFVSADGLRWEKLRETPLFPTPAGPAFDSQNLAFWSEAEGRYVLYFRTFKKVGATNYRWISRTTSPDFRTWTEPEEMDFGAAPAEHLYTNQTSPYFRAPQISIGVCARFLPGRQVLNEEQARAINVDPKYFKDCSDAVLLSTRGGRRYSRRFLEAFVRPGLGMENWVSRSNYPALNLIQTSATRMSFFVNRNYGQLTAYLARYELRLDGFASARAGYAGGELRTVPVRFRGEKLELNYSTSAVGSVRVELQEANGTPIPGYRLEEAPELIGDEVGRVYAWKGGPSVAALAGRPVVVRFVMKDADLYAYRFV